MALAAKTAALIVAAVAKDPDCRKIFPPRESGQSSSSWRGTVRNLKYFLQGKSPEDDANVADHACTGIARLTAMAIAGQRIPEVRHAWQTKERSRMGFKHTATKVDMRDGSAYVFDWHQTLEPLNPLIFPSEDAWESDQGGVYHVDFKGWNK